MIAYLTDIFAGSVVSYSRKYYDVIQSIKSVGLNGINLRDKRILLGIGLVSIIEALELLKGTNVLRSHLRMIIERKVEASVLLLCCVADDSVNDFFHIYNYKL